MIQFIFKWAKFWLLLLFSLFLTSCVKTSYNTKETIKGSKNIVSEIRPVNSDFDKIQVSSVFEVEVQQASDYEVTVMADDNLMEYIHTEISNKTLKIFLDRVSLHNPKQLKVLVKMPEIRELVASSSSEIKMLSGITTDNLKLKSSGTAEIDLLEVQAKKLAVEASSSSEVKAHKVYVYEMDIQTSSTAEFKTYTEADIIRLKATSSSEIELSGKALSMTIDASSTAEVDAKELKCNQIEANASSSATIKVYPILSLRAKASSASDIYYYNSPQNIEKETSSAASIKKG